MQRLPCLYFSPSAAHGRGIFTTQDIPADTVLEICPVIVLPAAQIPLIDQTLLYDYYFLWTEEDNSIAIALGFGSLYNHSYFPNAEYIPDYENLTFDFYTVRDIKAGEEITVNYNGTPNDPTPVWFDKKE